MWIIEWHLVARHYICELCNVILLQGIMYVNYAMPSCLASHLICKLYQAILFFVTYYICQQCQYIQLLFVCISHLTRWWQILEWKQGLQRRQCYPSKQISCWVPIAPQRWIQRRMTSPIPPWGVCSNLAGLCCSYRAYGVSHCYVIWLV